MRTLFGDGPSTAKPIVAGLIAATFLLAACTGPSDDDEATGPAPTEATSTTVPTAATVTAPTPNPPTTGSPPPTTSAAPADVDKLTVASPSGSVPGYRRAAFGDDWEYDPTTGCNTRERVLAEESLVPVDTDDRCRPLNGRWRSVYDGVETDDPAELQIDHFVALSNAWRSGAWSWTPEQRFEFANDLSDPATLVAVTGSSNQSKSDSGPEQWLPPDRSIWCRYADDWVRVKLRWNLSVNPAEKATLVQILSGC